MRRSIGVPGENRVHRIERELHGGCSGADGLPETAHNGDRVALCEDERLASRHIDVGVHDLRLAGIDPSTTVRVSDVLGGISHLLRLLTEEGGPVVVSPPVYNAFYDVIAAAGRRVVEAPLTADGRLDPVCLAHAFGEATAGWAERSAARLSALR